MNRRKALSQLADESSIHNNAKVKYLSDIISKWNATDCEDLTYLDYDKSSQKYLNFSVAKLGHSIDQDEAAEWVIYIPSSNSGPLLL